jgi:hypothetical protein
MTAGAKREANLLNYKKSEADENAAGDTEKKIPSPGRRAERNRD